MEYIDIREGYTKEVLSKVADIISLGGVVILPTDTVYGIAADVMNEDSIKRIYEIKNRESSNPMSILVSNLEMIKKVTKNLSNIEEKIVKEFFPGALTVVFEKNDKVSDIVTAGLNTVGIRMPNNQFLLELIELIGSPVVATSCNLSGKPSIVNCDIVTRKFKDKVECIINGGASKIGVPSTVIKIDGNHVNILRDGPIKKQQLVQSLSLGGKE